MERLNCALKNAAVSPDDLSYLQELAKGLCWKTHALRSDCEVPVVDAFAARERLEKAQMQLAGLEAKAFEFERLADRHRRLLSLTKQAERDIARLKQQS